MIGDPGSGHYLGQAALQVATSVGEGRHGSQRIFEGVLKMLGLASGDIRGLARTAGSLPPTPSRRSRR